MDGGIILNQFKKIKDQNKFYIKDKRLNWIIMWLKFWLSLLDLSFLKNKIKNWINNQIQKAKMRVLHIQLGDLE